MTKKIFRVFSGAFATTLFLILACAVVSDATTRSGRIAFASNRDGNTEIYTMKSDGTDQVRLTNNTSVDYQVLN